MSPRLDRDDCGDLPVLPFHVTLFKKRTTTYPGVLTEPHTYVYAYIPTSCAQARTHPNPAGPYVHVGYVSNVACLLCSTLDIPTHRPLSSVVTFSILLPPFIPRLMLFTNKPRT